MPGFLGVQNYLGHIIPDRAYDNLVIRSINFDRLWLQVRTINKFLNDKLCFEDNNFIILLEGVLLNKVELFKTHDTFTLSMLIKKLYKENGDSFFSCFRGSFSGILFEKQNHKLIVFTDHIGDKAVFYTLVGKQLFFGSELKFIAVLLKENNIEFNINIAAAYSALTYGYMISDLTYINNVNRLRGGTYLCMDADGKLAVIKYHQFRYYPNYKISNKEIINNMDILFERAVKSQVEKNREYGYFDFSSLSAGLDSRMTNFAISKIKQSEFTSFTYSAIGFHDHLTSAAIAKHLKNNYIFQSNNSGDLLLDIDKSINLNEGLYPYFAAAVLNDFFEKLNTLQIGLIHSGQIGDVIVGCFSKTGKVQEGNLKYFDMHSKILAEKFYNYFDFDSYIKMFPDREIYSIYNRGFMGVNSGAPFVFQYFTETYSPFCDVDFCEFCLTIPIKKRAKHYIYDKWIKQKYPDAALFKHNGKRVIGGYFNEINDFCNRATRKIGKMSGLWNDQGILSATPLNVWTSRDVVKKQLDEYFNQTIANLDNYKTLQDDCRLLYHSGSALEKNQVLTLLGAVKLLFS